MQPDVRISYHWKDRSAPAAYAYGVSLHSHTSFSEESLIFIHKMFSEHALLRPLFAFYERRSRENQGLSLDFVSANWRPPLQPRMAWRVEQRQIEDLGLEAMISITDHDNIEAPLLLRTLPLARHIPVSVEWSAPFGSTCFHIGVHNLPSATARQWMDRLATYTAQPHEDELNSILRDLHAIPQVLVVLNHPLWDLYKIGSSQHATELDCFLSANNRRIHAFELNGLRHSHENRDVMHLARRWGQVLLSGGDRHGVEGNANINLTSAATFTAFVHEVRVERKSHILFLDQYARPWEQRILASTLDAISDHGHFASGWQRWDERAFHRDREGVMRPLSELWPDGRPPKILRAGIVLTRLLRHRPARRALSLGFGRVNDAQLDEALYKIA